jgi:hypothetical protein
LPSLFSFRKQKTAGTSQEKEKEYSFLKYEQTPHSRTDTDTQPIAVKHDAFWSYCGPSLDCSSTHDLPPSFHDFAAATFTGDVPDALFPFLDFLKTFLAGHGLGHYLLTVRATTPTHEFDRPRWHTDELFFSAVNGGDLPGTRLGLTSVYDDSGKKENKKTQSSPSSSSSPRGTPAGTNWKICTTLLGPSTMFIPLEHQITARDTQRRARQDASTDHDCLSIRCVGCASSAETVRDTLASELAQYGVEAAGPGECALFQVGRDAGAVHSEPRMDDGDRGRIFVNVVPGTEEELRAMMEKWGMEFPRQWWIGSNVVKKPTTTASSAA